MGRKSDEGDEGCGEEFGKLKRWSDGAMERWGEGREGVRSKEKGEGRREKG